MYIGVIPISFSSPLPSLSHNNHMMLDVPLTTYFLQVTVRQNELNALRLQLLETSDETEKLMIKIEQDTFQVSR